MSSHQTMRTTATLDGRTARRLETRRKVLTAATDLFAERGYAATTMDEVADAAGVSKGALFYNFDSKQALFADILDQATGRLVEVQTEAVQGRSGWAALEHLGRALIVAVDESPALIQLLVMEVFRDGRPWTPQLRDIRSRLLAPMTATLLQVREERLDEAPTNPPEVAEAVAMAMFGALCFAALDRQAFAPARTTDDMADVLFTVIAGLRPGSRPTRDR